MVSNFFSGLLMQ